MNTFSGNHVPELGTRLLMTLDETKYQLPILGNLTMILEILSGDHLFEAAAVSTRDVLLWCTQVQLVKYPMCNPRGVTISQGVV